MDAQGRKNNWKIPSSGVGGVKNQKDRNTYEIDYPEHAYQVGFTAAERKEMKDTLQRSSLPKGFEPWPVPTSADTMKMDPDDGKNTIAD